MSTPILTVPTLPECVRTKQRECAEDAATAILQAIAATGRCCCVYMDPTGRITWASWLLPDVVPPDASSLVGCYDDDARVAEIAADIIALQEARRS